MSTLSLFCEIVKVSLQADKFRDVLDTVQRRIENLEEVVAQEERDSNTSFGKEASVSCKVGQVEDRVTEVELKLDNCGGFNLVKGGSRVDANVNYSSVVTTNIFQVLEDEVRDEPSLILVGDSLIRHQDEEFCKNGPKSKHVCYPGRRIEDITEKVDDLVGNASEDTVFVYFAGTNNVLAGRSEEILRKYKALVNKLREGRRRSVICGLIARYDVNSLILSRMLGINTRLQDLCKREGVGFVDVWDHFNRDRSLYGKDGLHLGSVGKARLCRLLDDGVRKELERNILQTQVGKIPPRQHWSGNFLAAGSLDEMVSRAHEVRHAGIQVGEREVGIRSMAADRSLGVETVPGSSTHLNV